MNTKEDKRTLFLDMQEHPERYTDAELRAMLDDPEMSEDIEVFETLRQAELRHSSDIADEEIEAELDKFMKRNSSKGGSRRLLRVAAMFVGCILAAGIAFAAIRMVVERTPMPIAETEMTAGDGKTMPTVEKKEKETAEATDSIVRFEEADLETIVNTMAEYYGVEAQFGNNNARHIRLFLVWNKQQSLDDVVKILNGYDRFNVEIDDKTLIIK